MSLITLVITLVVVGVLLWLLAAVAGLTVYDMVKGVDRSAMVRDLKLIVPADCTVSAR